jgi:ABC-type antimicrobial peptide transport system permease subunit
MMKIIRTALLIAGILAVLIGLVWVGQGSGYFPYPSTSFMVNEMPWVYRGVALAVAGLISVAVSRWI